MNWKPSQIKLRQKKSFQSNSVQPITSRNFYGTLNTPSGTLDTDYFKNISLSFSSKKKQFLKQKSFFFQQDFFF